MIPHLLTFHEVFFDNSATRAIYIARFIGRRSRKAHLYCSVRGHIVKVWWIG